MFRSRHNHSKGFTLIEMAFIIMIIGILAATILPRLVSGIKVDRAREAKANLIEARDEIIGVTYIDEPKHQLPLASGTEQVPTTLKHTTDPWNSPITYIIANNQDGNPLTDGYAICNATNTDLEVVINGVTYNDIAFILASPGKDMTTEYTDAAGPPRVITGYAPGYTGPDSLGGNIDEYDDLIEFVTLDYLKEKVCSSAPEQGPPGSPLTSISFDDGEGYSVPAGGSASSTTMGDGTGIGDVLELDDTATGYVILDNPLLYRMHEFTIMGWFKTIDGTVDGGGDGYEPIINRESTAGAYNDRNFWLVTWADNTTQGHVEGEFVFKASNERLGAAHFNHDTQAQDRYTTAAPPGTLTDGTAHHDTQWHFFATTMTMDINASDECTFNGATVSNCSLQDYNTQAEYNHTLTMYISDNPDDADLIVSTNQQQTTGPELGPNGTTIPGTIWPTYIGRETGVSGRSFDGYVDEFVIYNYALSAAEIEAYYDNFKAYYVP